MFSEPIKHLLLTAIGLSVLAGCSSDKSKETEQQAAQLLSESRECFETGRYEEALRLLDSIDRSLPGAVKTRKEASQFRPEVLERHTARQLSLTDSLMTVNSILGDSLRSLLEYVSNPIEGYYAVKGEGATNVRDKAGLHCRVSADYHFYIVATSAGGRNATAVQLSAGGKSVRSNDVPYDGERNCRTGAGMSITFTEAESAPLADFIEEIAAPGNTVEMAFLDNGRPVSTLTLTPEQLRSAAIISGFSRAVRNDKKYRIEKQRLQSQLEIARQQIANAH